MAQTDISGLREQVLTNAVHAFPSVVKDHLCYHKAGIVKPNEIFDIVVVSDGDDVFPQFQAYLTYGDSMTRQVAFKAKKKNSIKKALMSLLGGTGEEFVRSIAERPVLMTEQVHGEVNDILRG